MDSGSDVRFTPTDLNLLMVIGWLSTELGVIIDLLESDSHLSSTMLKLERNQTYLVNPGFFYRNYCQGGKTSKNSIAKGKFRAKNTTNR